MNRKKMQSEELKNIDTHRTANPDDEIDRLKRNSHWYILQIDGKGLTGETITLYLSRLSQIIYILNKWVVHLNKELRENQTYLSIFNSEEEAVYDAASVVSQKYLGLIDNIENEIDNLHEYITSIQSNINDYVCTETKSPSEQVKRRILPLPNQKDRGR